MDDLLKVFSLLPSLHNVYLDRGCGFRRSPVDTNLSSAGVYTIISYFLKHKPTSTLYISIRCAFFL